VSRPSRTFAALHAACRAATATGAAEIDWGVWEAALNDSDPGDPGVTGVKETSLVAGAGLRRTSLTRRRLRERVDLR
jgi:hypothetical protein